MKRKQWYALCVMLFLLCFCTACGKKTTTKTNRQPEAMGGVEANEEAELQKGSFDEKTGAYKTLQGSLLTKEQYQNLKYSFSKSEIDKLGSGVLDMEKDNQELWASFSCDSCIWTDGFIHAEKQDKINQDTAIQIAKEEAEHIPFLADSGVLKYNSSVVKTAHDEKNGIWRVVFTGDGSENSYNMETAVLAFISDDGITQMILYPELSGASGQEQTEEFSYTDTVWTKGFLHTEKGEKINRNTAMEIAREEVEAIPVLKTALAEKKETNVECDGSAGIYKVTFLNVYPDDAEYEKEEKTESVAKQVGTSIIVFVNVDGTTNRIVYPEW